MGPNHDHRNNLSFIHHYYNVESLHGIFLVSSGSAVFLGGRRVFTQLDRTDEREKENQFEDIK